MKRGILRYRNIRLKKYSFIVVGRDIPDYTEKMQLETLIQKLKRKDDFDHWSFLTQDKGDRVIATLGVPKWGGKDGKELLQCKHISKITYGKKVVFQR